MAGQPGRIQSSFASGELGDILVERTNLKYYRSGLKRAENALVLAQGPATQRPYTRQIGRRRNILSAISYTGATLGAPNGGAPAYATDGNPATLFVTNGIGGAGPVVLFSCSFTGPRAVSAVDVGPYSRSSGEGRISVEYQDGTGSWQALGPGRKLITASRSRRFCAPPAEPVSASAWRVVARSMTGTAPVTIGDVKFWSEGTTPGPARLRSFAYSRAQAYDLVLMEGHGDVYAAEGGWLTGFALPHNGVESQGRWRQQLNTGLLFAPTRQTWRIFRENDDFEWECGAAPYDHIPDHDFGDTAYTNGEPSIWDFQPVNITASCVFEIEVEGETTDGIASNFNPDTTGEMATLTQRIIDALERLPNLKPGLTYTVEISPLRGRVTFNGNDGEVLVSSVRVLNKADAALSWLRVQKGKKGGEPIYSDGRGWPRAGIFYQQRLITGGAAGTPNALLLSLTGDYYDLNTELSSASGGFIAPMDTEGEEAIVEFLTTRALLIFTTGREYWVSNSAISKDTPLSPVPASSYGCAENVPVVENEGGAVFVAREGSVLCEFRYNETDQTYVTAPISVLASHLVNDVVDLGIRRSHTNTDANTLAFVQADGALRFVALLRSQDVTAFSRVTTDGQFRSVAVNAANRMTVLADRLVDGETVQFVERFEDGLLLDQAVSFAFEDPTDTVTGLADHEGASVWAIADDDVHGPLTVAGGTITLPAPASTVTVGRWTPFLVETLPPSREVGPEIVTQSDIGFHTVRVSLRDTTSVAIGANGEPAEDVPLIDFGAQADLPELAGGFTGLRERDGLTGSLPRPSMTVTQVRPGRITLLSITGEGDQ